MEKKKLNAFVPSQLEIAKDCMNLRKNILFALITIWKS